MPYYTYNSNLRDRNKFTSTVETTFGTKRYFSQLDTEVYFGAIQIDEIVAIDFTIGEPKLPIYGFNSFYANRIVSGRRTIQGTFAINFTNPMYLVRILSQIEDSVLKASFVDSDGNVVDYESLVYRCEGDDSTGLGIGNSPLFKKMFDITLSYGYGKTEGMQTYNSCYQTLVGVQIVDYRQALDTEGNPILDMYSFIAKDIRFQEALYQEGEGPEPKPDIPIDTPIEEPEPPEDPGYEYVVANEKIKKEMDQLNSKCQNSNIPGYIVNPTFNYTPAGSHAGSAYPYLRLYIDSVNDSTEKFTQVYVSIRDGEHGVNIALNANDVKKGGYVLHEFKDAAYDAGVTLRQLYTKDKENYAAECTIEFVAIIDGRESIVKHTTKLNLGSTLY